MSYLVQNSIQAYGFAFVNPRPEARLRLFCFPFAGGSALVFRDWQSFLPHWIEVFPVELPGRGTRLREGLLPNLDILVKNVADGLQTLLDKPFAFFGHSMGALIAFELSRLLRRNRMPLPQMLLISGRSAPHLEQHEKKIYNLPESEFINEIKALKGTPAQVLENSELMQLLIPILRADFQVCETMVFKEEPLLTCPISVFGGEDDMDVPVEDLQSWRELTTGSFSCELFPGSHFFIQESQAAFLAKVTESLVRNIK